MPTTLARQSATLLDHTPVSLALSNENEVAVIAIVGTFILVLTAIAFTQLRQILQIRAREATRREIAAYVAEGSMSPDDAARLLGTDQSDFERKIGEAVKWGMISAGKAEKLINVARESASDCSKDSSAKPSY